MRCIIDGCLKPVAVKSRGWCKRHWTRWHRHGDPTVVLQPRKAKTCGVDGCDRNVHGNGWCSAHWERVRRVGDVCAPIPIGASPHELRAFLNPPPPACADCGGVPFGGTIRCETCLRAEMARLSALKPVGNPKGSGDPGRTAVRQVSMRGVAA